MSNRRRTNSHHADPWPHLPSQTKVILNDGSVADLDGLDRYGRGAWFCFDCGQVDPGGAPCGHQDGTHVARVRAAAAHHAA